MLQWFAGFGVFTLIAAAIWFYVFVAIRPSGPYTPIVKIDYFLDQPGATREITFNPVFLRNHEIAVISTKPFPVETKFDWKLNAKVYRFGMKIDDRNLLEERRSVVGPDQKSSDDISFGWIEVLDLLPGDAQVLITVVEPEQSAANYREALKLIVRPSPIL
jgi:hypothetical protein